MVPSSMAARFWIGEAEARPAAAAKAMVALEKYILKCFLVGEEKLRDY